MMSNHSVIHPDNHIQDVDSSNPVVNDQHSSMAKATVYGYIRVSTREQNEARQVIALREFGVPEDCLFMDKLSGKDFQRPAYQALLAALSPSDVMVIKSIDRLGRNYDEILEQWRVITKEKGSAIVVLDMPLLDTRNSRDLTGTLIADIVLQLLSYVAETERAFIRQRQAEGIAAAKARGTHFGPKPRDRSPLYPSVKAQWQRQEISATEAGKILGCTHNTFLKWVRSDSSSDPSILS
jgi:DNA invertase Pin-like site-specific DNA recombinase